MTDDGPVHFGIEDAAFAPSPEADLEDLELGERVSWEFLMWRMASAYSDQEAREQAAVLALVGSVARSTSHIGLPYPVEWWPFDPTEHPPSGWTD